MMTVFTRQALRVLFVALGVVLFSQAGAAEVPDPQVEKIRNSLSAFLPSLTSESIRPTPVPGLYEVAFASQLFYVSEDGRYIVQGAIYDLEQQQDLTKPRLSELRAAVIEDIGEENMLIYEPAETRYQVTVFTDIDCPYCRKMHAQMNEYLAKGIRFRYLFYPRAGKGSSSYDKAVSVWCADDRHAAMDQAKQGADMPKRSCENPVDKHLELGSKMPIRGTPAIVLEDGEVMPGYVPPARLLALLEARKQGTQVTGKQ
jgi:thiol:disulfide interchange protein DsbC